MIFKNCDGASAGDLRPDRRRQRAVRAGRHGVSRRDMPDGVRSARVLRRRSRRGCSAVFACNAYVDEQAPWALRKTDPERMQTVLATLFIAIARARGRDPAGDADSRRPSCSTRWASPPTSCDFDGICDRDWYSPLAESDFRLDAAGRAVPAARAAGRGRRLMLIDSHCHLEYEGLVEDQHGGARARARRRASAASSTSRPGRANGTGWSPPPSASPTSGPASASTRTRPTATPISARRRCSRRPSIRG